MILGAMQPYFLPYPGYFDLIDRADQWIVFDTVQYIRRGWMNRNRVLHPTEGWQYVVMPLRKHTHGTRICDVQITNDVSWKSRLLGQLQHYRKRAPFFAETMSFLESALNQPTQSLVALNTHLLSAACERLGIEFNYQILTEANLELGPVEGPGDWALRLGEALGASEYLNPPGGADLFDPTRFQEAGMRLTVQDFHPLEYETRGYEFVANLSIVDAFMWMPPHEIAAQMRERRIT